MSGRGSLVIPFLMLVGCTPSARPVTPTPPPLSECSSVNLQPFMGSIANSESGAKMMAASGARSLRWVAPGMAVTMDYRADRLTVSYDTHMVILTAHCG